MILSEAKDRLVDAGARVIDSYSDETGVWGFRLAAEGETFVLVAKERDHEKKASFLKEAVERAVAGGYWLLWYNADTDAYRLYDAEYVESNGVSSVGKSKTREAEWLEVDIDAGVDFADFIAGRGVPESVDATYDSHITDYSG